MEITKEEQPVAAECSSLENNSNFNLNTDCEGSSLGKFKNSDELYKAYVNLEKEFTKKCQKIKELETAKDNEIKTPENSDNVNISPNAEELVLKNNVESRSVSIKEMLTETIKHNGIDTVSHNDIMVNTIKKEDLLNNKELRDRFIENYLNEIQSQQSAPLIVNSVSGNFCVAPISKPKNIKDAGEIVKEMLNN